MTLSSALQPVSLSLSRAHTHTHTHSLHKSLTMASVLYKTPRGEGPVKREAEVGASQTQAKEGRQPPEAGKRKSSFPALLLEGTQPCQSLDFGLLASTVVREYTFVVLCHRFV